jgi:hypothetical protein
LGVDPPDNAIVNRPRAATASFAERITSSAAAANSSCGVVKMRTSGEELKALNPYMLGPTRIVPRPIVRLCR